MFSLDELFNICDKIAPISISHSAIKNGEYDNSGIIVRTHENVSGIMFALDASCESVKRAIENGCDTIVTHHPAIYHPIKNLDYKCAETSPIVLAVENKMNIISMHLNLDMAENGIDKNLAKGLLAKEVKILDYVDDIHGYGREFDIDIKFGDYVKYIKKEFNSEKILAYGSDDDIVNKVASFCGGGSGYAEKMIFENRTLADTIITSDMAHHDIKYLLDSGKKIILIPHYVSESYGFKKFYEDCEKLINKRVNCFYFDDKRFW